MDLSTTLIALLVVAALAAGFVDAVVGGGGLIQLPALLIGLPGAPVVEIAATNKLASFCGTSISAATYVRRIKPDPRTFLPLMLAAFIGSSGGALVASLLPRSAFDPIILVVLVVVGTYVWFKPSVGELTRLRFSGGQHMSIVAITGLGIGFYDGAIGPGTGSFFVVALVGLLGYNFLEASAKAKLANWATNLAALVVFVPQGAVLWQLALPMAAANIVGGYLGARVAVARGARFVRVFFLVVVAALVIRLAAGLLF
ncbi:TSUP family transporter [Nocardioides piscis]|uniref:Probable membrane transporter protein n=1 Tax=Nocardioides piscis TaxID=2714938 RepID=A0A6G7YC85_9ACTN|nr:TSUP family transporter [Nocardioides piscis]QIK74248.1 TSUP family transporter [Nocardioides piscis]